MALLLSVILTFPYVNFVLFFTLRCLILIKMRLVKTHILSFLLILEVFILLNLYMLAMYLGGSLTSFSLLFVFFTCAVCEACVGIGVIIQTSR